MADPIRSSSANLIEEVYTGSAENTYFKSPLVAESYRQPYNQDELWQKTGSYSIYQDMANDDQVSVCLQLKKDLVIGAGFDFISESDDQQEIVEFLCDALDDSILLEGLEEILTAYEFGFSITEKIFGQNSESKTVLKDLRTRHPNSWLIYQDDKGNITKYEQNTSVGRLDIDPKCLIHFINSPKFQNPYGTSDLRACYAAWFAKRQVVRYYGMYLEKAASPTPIARYDKNAPDSAISKIFNTIKKLQSSTAMAIPKEIEIEFLESKTNGEAYAKAINIFNMFIGRSLFIPDLLGLTGSETSGGSFALGKEQIAIFFMHIARRRAALEKTINDHIVWPMIVSNFGFIEEYPKFRFKPLDDMKAIELAKVWLDAVKSNVFPANEDEVNYFRSLCKFPEGEVKPKAQPPQLFPGINPVEPPQDPNILNDEGEEDEETTDEETSQDVSSTKAKSESADSEKANEEKRKVNKRQFGKIFNLPSGDYHKKVDFKKIEAKLDDYDNSVLVEAMPIIKKQFKDLADQIQKKGILKNQDVSKIDKLQIKYLKELKQVLKTSFAGIYKDGQNLAQAELMKSNFAQPVASDEFLAMLEEETFQYIGDYQYTILKKTRAELIAAIKDGAPLSSVLDILDSEGKQLAEVSLERYARTKHTEVLNKGRIEFFESSGVVAGYQYSAILDDVTSEICRGLDGKYFDAGNQPIPPMHFNCRSVLIPITKYEAFTPSTSVGQKPIDEFIDEKKGAGFSKFSKEIKVTDPGVEFIVEDLTPDSQITTYSKDGKVFQKTIITYKTAEKLEVSSVKHLRDNDSKV